MTKTCCTVALSVAIAAGAANAQCLNDGESLLLNSSFETPTNTLFGVDQNVPYGWTTYSGPSMALRRTVGDGQTPALLAVGTPGALTPHTGNSVFQLGRQNSTPANNSFPPGVYAGLSTDVRYAIGCPSEPPDPPNPNENPAYCHQNFFDVDYDWANNGDVIVTMWYMIPTDMPVTGAAGSGNGAGGVKLSVKTICQNVATKDVNTDPASPDSIHGTTNGQWQQYKVVYKNRDIRWEWYRNVYGTGPTDCDGGTGEGCACVPATPLPSRVKIEPSRWSGNGASTGVIFIDDVDVIMACKADLDNGEASGTPDGGVDINDLIYFLTLFEAGDPSGDLTGMTDPSFNELPGFPDCGVDINDLLFFLSHFEGGC